MSTHLNSEYVIRRLYQITNDYNKGFAHQINALLQMGLERFDLDIGILSNIDQDLYTVQHCVVPKDIAIQPGDQFDYNLTYCKITCTSSGPLALENVGQDDELGSHPAYRSLGLESYIGIPIHLNGKIFGTLNFSSPKPYIRKFKEIDIDALQLMASWIEVELIRREQEEKLLLLNKKLQLQVNHDILTNLPNRRYMYKTLHKEVNQMIRIQGKSALAVIDIDYFKNVNDKYGHQKGDEVLVSVAKKITKVIRNYDFVARLGGEEFLLWLPHTDQYGANIVCEKIMKSISSLLLIEEPLTVSIGVCNLDFKSNINTNLPKLVDKIIAKADQALYQAKSKGRNCFVSDYFEFTL